jgi:pectin methylesterase-like acyl-CoA thioesterase
MSLRPALRPLSNLNTRIAAWLGSLPRRDKLAGLAGFLSAVLLLGLLPTQAAVAATDTTAPSKPSSVSATYYGGVGTVLTWGKVSAKDLAAYRVYRSTAKSMTVANSTLVATTTSRTAKDVAVQARSTFYYAVSAVDASGNASALSTVKSVTTTDTKKPDTPSSLKATSSAAGVALNWSDNDEPDLAGYTVARRTSSSGPWTTVAAGIPASQFTDATAPSGTKSYYRVTAVDRAGNVSSYASTSATRPAGPVAAPTAPAAPAGFAAKLSSAGVPQLTWTASTGATGYVLSRATSANGPFTRITTSTGTSYTDAAAPAKQTVHYTLTATNTAGASAAATASIAVPGDTTAPARPSSPKVTLLPTGGVTVTWAANKDADLAGYTVLKRDGNEVYQPYLPTSGAAHALPSFTDPSVLEGTVGYYRVRAVDTSGNVSSSYLAITANNPDKAPGVPSSLKVSQSATAGLTLTWKAPADVDVAGYSILRSTSSSTGFGLLQTITATAGTTPTFADTSAPKGVTVYYRVVAVDSVGNASSNSSTVSGTSLTNPIALPLDETVLTVGSGKQFATIAAALDSIPANNLKRYRIDIDPGVYTEYLRIRSAFITLNGTGDGPADTVLRYAHASGSPDPAAPGETLGTSDSYVLRVDAADTTLRNLTVENAFDEAANPQMEDQQAVALRVEGDRFVADRVRLLGNQDTLLADTPKPTTRIRQYYVDSYIEGDVDFVFGAANAVFERVTFRALDRGKSTNGYVFAPSTDVGSKYGFLVVDSKIVSDAAAGTFNLGRPWHPSADENAQGSTVLMNTWLPAAIDAAAPWDDMASTNSDGVKVNFPWTTGRFFEHKNVGPGATVNANRPQLSDSNAAKLTVAAQLAGKDGWSPQLAGSTAAPAAPKDLTAATDLRVVHLTWGDDDSAAVTGWSVYRADETGAFAKIGTTDRPVYSDTTVSTGAAYRYVVTADNRAGVSSAPSSEVSATVIEAALGADYRVDPSAAPNETTFATLADALAAAPAGTATDPTVIELAAGRYPEYDVVSKPYTVLVGATGNAKDVVITGDRAAGTPTGTVTNGVPDTYGTSGSATLVITASNVQLRDLTVENAYQEGRYANGQAVALRTTGDRLVYDNVRLLGNQDTLYANSPAPRSIARTYIHDSLIEGDVDFIFGRGTVVIDASTLSVTDHGTTPNGALTAASTNVENPYGFLITNSRVIGAAPNGSQNLGRPWQPGISQPDGTSVRDESAIGQVTVRNTWLGPVVSSTAWTDMTNSGFVTSWKTARFFEYGNTGPGAATGENRPQLTAEQAEQYTAERYLAGADGWNPVREQAADTAPARVAGLVATGDDASVSLDWADSAEVDVTAYRVYRASGADEVAADSAHLIAEVTSSAFRDENLKNGTEYSYVVVAVDAAGNLSEASSVEKATAAPKPLVADITVAKDGSGDVTSLQAALTAIPAGTAAAPKVILIEPGTYREVVNSSKPYVILASTTGKPEDVIVTYDNANGTPRSADTCPFVAATAATCGTGGSATVTLTGSGVEVRGITIENAFDKAKHPEIGPNNTQAVALRATGDRQVYRNVRFLGVQDTLNADANGNISANGSGYPRQYYVDSLIEGNVDYVFGRASAVFQRVTFVASAHNGGTIFAPSTASKALGYLVVDSRFASENDPGTFALGRPWRGWGDGTQADNSRGQTVIRNSWIAAGFDTAKPWTDFAPNAWTDGRLFEYGNTGPGATINANRPQLTADAAAAMTPSAWLAGSDGWDPVVASGDDVAPAAPAGLTATGSDGQAVLSWQENAESDVAGYNVYRDGALLATTDRAAFTSTGLKNDLEYTFTVTALDAAGHESAVSATAAVTPKVKIDATVASDGSGDYSTLQAAVDAAPSTGWVIRVAPGTYAGTTVIAKPNITVIGGGDKPEQVVLTSAVTGNAATVSVSGASVTVRGVTLQNTAAGTAPALSMTGDKVLVSNSVISSTGNRTIFADTSTHTVAARQMITGSTIVGGNDTVLGRASLVINDSTLKIRTNGTVLTPSTAENAKGFLLVNSRIETDAGANVQLGRPYRAWDTITPKSVGQAVVRDSVLGAGVKVAQPWGTGPSGEPWTLGRFTEFGNTGDGATQNANRPQLSPADSVAVTVGEWLGAATWYPAVADPATPGDVEPTAAVTALAAEAGDGGASLSWTPPTGDDLAGYRVYRSTGATAATSAASLVATLGPVSSWQDSGLTNGTQYTYAVRAVDTAGNVSAVATVSVTPADTVAPEAPASVTATPGDSKIALSWAANTEGDLGGYNVYRDGQKLNSALLTAAAFTERELVNGTEYTYSVTAVDRFGNESAKSDTATAAPAPGDNEAPAAPSAASTELGKGSVTVRWSGVDADDLASYIVLRSEGGAVATAVATVGAGTTSWTDTAVTVGTAYAYSVVAVDGSDNRSAASASATITPIKVDVLVDPNGGGDAATVAEAVNSLPNGADFTTQGYRTILVRPGTYQGIVDSGNRYGVKLIGSTGNAEDVVLTAGGGSVATFTISNGSREWTVQDLTLQSVATAAGGQATALQVKSGDKQVFSNVRFLGDTKALLVSTANATTYSRVYITGSYIEGGADLLLGRAITVIERSTIRVLNRSQASITDSSVNAASPYGFLITDSVIEAEGAANSIYLGRPYPEAASTQSQVVVRNTSLPAALNVAQPWKDWNAATPWTAGRFFEWGNTGAGAGTNEKRPQLTAENESQYTAQAYLAGGDGWNPTGR